LVLLAVIPAVAQSLHLLVAAVVAAVLGTVARIKAALAGLVAVAFVCAAMLGALTAPPATVGFLHLVLALLATGLLLAGALGKASLALAVTRG
jgi:hypothetical protein